MARSRALWMQPKRYFVGTTALDNLRLGPLHRVMDMQLMHPSNCILCDSFVSSSVVTPGDQYKRLSR